MSLMLELISLILDNCSQLKSVDGCNARLDCLHFIKCKDMAHFPYFRGRRISDLRIEGSKFASIDRLVRWVVPEPNSVYFIEELQIEGESNEDFNELGSNEHLNESECNEDDEDFNEPESSEDFNEPESDEHLNEPECNEDFNELESYEHLNEQESNETFSELESGEHFKETESDEDSNEHLNESGFDEDFNEHLNGLESDDEPESNEDFGKPEFNKEDYCIEASTLQMASMRALKWELHDNSCVCCIFCYINWYGEHISVLMSA